MKEEIHEQQPLEIVQQKTREFVTTRKGNYTTG
jgi:hypothetical protein